MKKVDDLISQHKDKAYSSNPYEYIANDDHYKNIVALGPDALRVIKNEIEQSNFLPKPGLYCDFCDFKLICPAWQ